MELAAQPIVFPGCLVTMSHSAPQKRSETTAEENVHARILGHGSERKGASPKL